MLVLGIDPGTSVTGYGLVEDDGGSLVLRESGVFRSPATLPLARRIRLLCTELESLLDRFSPDGVAVEGLFHQRSVRSVLMLAHLRGAYLLTLDRRQLDVREYSPAEVKKAVTGQGAASKQQVQEMVRRLLGLTQFSGPLDASDALAVALCHAQVSRFARSLGV